MSTGGLSRRRVNNSSNPNGDTDETLSASASPSLINTDSRRDCDHHIAFDPRDLAEGEERSKQAPLTMMEEILLLGLKDKQGYLSFWNDNISYTLRGCILIELALRGKISMQKDHARKRYPLADRLIELVDEKLTGEVLLDEALKMIKASEKLSINTWCDLMSGETWNLMKIGYQLKQVRERLAKGLVDKGILRTEKKNFLLFDMATHPVVDSTAKDEIRRRVLTICTARQVSLPGTKYLPEHLPFRAIRSVAMVCASYAANVLENALVHLSHDAREQAFSRVDELLSSYSQWPFGIKIGGGAVGQNLGRMVQEEVEGNKDKELHLEVVAGVLQVFTRLESLL
ncbi:Vacuolar protein sorting-associated protein 74 [Neolecta irregularis DAH-3]|uniref:Vacuolar protein sorting-associated protein 74 n=1 Tax=Neolecta irregularis (strain DAH-3) TaxID=1198029 RepID=A0A1U7LS42_NEOID|nr:Vacuolar protein sorting-associated protein 74 [Neolecta irregularis DAH-3]|eukprot:OLL25362.1 Vacuolar protein sorting-associated protein 74 [Neolecta irregularis DAH-3]